MATDPRSARLAQGDSLDAFDDRIDEVRRVWCAEPERRSEVAALALELPESLVDQDPVLLRARAFAHIERGRFDLSTRDAERAVRRCEERGDTVGMADAGLDVAYALRERTNWEGSSAWLERVEGGRLTPAQRLRLLNMRIVEAVSHRRDFARARRLHGQVEDLALKEGDTMALLTSVINRALGMERLAGRYDRMRDAAAMIERVYGGVVPPEDEHYRRRIHALAAFDTGGDVESAVADLANLGDRASTTYAAAIAALWHAGHGQRERSREAADVVLKGAYPGNVALLLARLALARLDALDGRGRQALETTDEALAESEEPTWAAIARIEAAKIARLAGDEASAEHRLEEAIAMAVSHAAPFLELRGRVVLAASRYSADGALRVVELADRLDYGEAVARRDPEESAIVFARALERGIAIERVRRWMAHTGVAARVVRLIGPLSLVADERAVGRADWARPKARTLFAYLAYHDRPVSVSRILEDLWPGAPEDASRRSLKVACSYIRRVVGAGAVEWRDRQLRLNLGEPSWIDVRAARLAARSQNASLKRRVCDEIGGGRLLEEFDEGWADAARDEFASVWSRLSEDR
ncbi:MAG: hypothetical protein KIS66_14245 [Fimbriimonadaceae bacterium]|nr:hypothetical protein [Fimbriimonadaceae bacterium]